MKRLNNIDRRIVGSHYKCKNNYHSKANIKKNNYKLKLQIFWIYIYICLNIIGMLLN